jgi:hypothetical protein
MALECGGDYVIADQFTCHWGLDRDATIEQSLGEDIGPIV